MLSNHNQVYKLCRLMLVDDHHIVRQSLANFINAQEDLQVIAEAASGEEAIELANALSFEIILMDLSMQGCNGLQAIRRIRENNLHINIMVLSSFSNEALVKEALEVGANGYVPKEATTDELLIAIRALCQRGSYFHPAVSAIVKELSPGQYTMEELTQRERDVMRLIARGLSNQQIAEELFIGIKTVKTHVSNVLSKLKLRDRTQVAIYSLNHCI